ncbi:MAG: hypothetical protein JWQ98_3613 [Chlorobi bacterium]|nr:hypothetical protein [Chlorobiota bacterium]
MVPLLALCCCIASCAPSLRWFAGAQSEADDRLYFGREIPGRGALTEDEWRGFLRDAVTPKFPDGLTHWNAEGQWRNSSGAIVREETFVLELIHPDSERDDAAIAGIIERYKSLFHQESVLRVKSLAVVGF